LNPKEGVNLPGYDITHHHMRDEFGALLWIEELMDEKRLYRVGDKPAHTFLIEGTYVEAYYVVVREAIADNFQHVNLAVVEEDVVISSDKIL